MHIQFSVCSNIKCCSTFSWWKVGFFLTSRLNKHGSLIRFGASGLIKPTFFATKTPNGITGYLIHCYFYCKPYVFFLFYKWISTCRLVCERSIEDAHCPVFSECNTILKVFGSLFFKSISGCFGTITGWIIILGNSFGFLTIRHLISPHCFSLGPSEFLVTKCLSIPPSLLLDFGAFRDWFLVANMFPFWFLMAENLILIC